MTANVLKVGGFPVVVCLDLNNLYVYCSGFVCLQRRSYET